MRLPAEMPFRPILLAPVTVGLWYLIVATVDFADDGDPWVYWVVALFTVIGHLVFVPAGILLLVLVRPPKRLPFGICVFAGAAVAFGTTLVAVWPNPNFWRWRYYAYAVMAGILWGIAFLDIVATRLP